MNLNPGVQLRGWPLGQTNGHRRWNGGRKSTTHTASRSRTARLCQSLPSLTGDVSLAAKQVEALLAQPGGPAPIDIVFAGQVAARHSDPVLALDYAERALADKRARPYDILSAATLILSVTSPSSQPYASAWQQIEDVARDPKNPGSLDALAVLANEQAAAAHDSDRQQRCAFTAERFRTNRHLQCRSGDSARERIRSFPGTSVATGSTPPPSATLNNTATQSSDAVALDLGATPPPASAGRTMSLTEVANALENHPDARPYHKLLALEVRARHDPALADQYIADAVEHFGNAARLAQSYQGGAELANETLTALAAWLNKIGRPAKTLEVLPRARAIQRQDLFLQYINALVALQRWSDIKDLLLSENSVADPVLQHMYLAVAQTHLGSELPESNEWQRALQVAKTAEKLLILANFAEQNSVNDIADSAYSEAIKIGPQNRAAYTGRLRLALAAGDTAKAQTIAAEITQLWPDDAAARNQDAYLRLLLGASDGSAEAAQREAQVLVAKEPRNWQARATLGLACLRLGRNQEALAAIREPRVTGVEPPGALAVRAAILAANGYEQGARNDALLTSAKPLLPEERALIAPLLQ